MALIDCPECDYEVSELVFVLDSLGMCGRVQ